MGCGSSSAQQQYVTEPKSAAGTAKPVAPVLLAKGKGKGRGGAKASSAKGKGKGKGKGKLAASKFQIELENNWENYGAEEDAILKRAYLVGHPNAKYYLRGQPYEYNFKTMTQKNLSTGKQRSIRPPYGWKPPAAPLLPPGGMVVIIVPEGAAGQTITINDPNHPGQKIEVAVPAGAKKGAKMAVPVPEKGETVADVRKKQAGWSTGSKVAMGVAAAGAAVGGVILGDYLVDGEFDTGVGEWAAGAAESVGDWVEGDAVPWVEGAAEDAGAWAEGAAEDVAAWAEGAWEDAGEWVPEAAEDAGEWIAGAAEDVGDWLGDCAEDTGDFVMSLF